MSQTIKLSQTVQKKKTGMEREALVMLEMSGYVRIPLLLMLKLGDLHTKKKPTVGRLNLATHETPVSQLQQEAAPLRDKLKVVLT